MSYEPACLTARVEAVPISSSCLSSRQIPLRRVKFAHLKRNRNIWVQSCPLDPHLLRMSGPLQLGCSLILLRSCLRGHCSLSLKMALPLDGMSLLHTHTPTPTPTHPHTPPHTHTYPHTPPPHTHTHTHTDHTPSTHPERLVVTMPSRFPRCK